MPTILENIDDRIRKYREKSDSDKVSKAKLKVLEAAKAYYIAGLEYRDASTTLVNLREEVAIEKDLLSRSKNEYLEAQVSAYQTYHAVDKSGMLILNWDDALDEEERVLREERKKSQAVQQGFHEICQKLQSPEKAFKEKTTKFEAAKASLDKITDELEILYKKSWTHPENSTEPLVNEVYGKMEQIKKQVAEALNPKQNKEVKVQSVGIRQTLFYVPCTENVRKILLSTQIETKLKQLDSQSFNASEKKHRIEQLKRLKKLSKNIESELSTLNKKTDPTAKEKAQIKLLEKALDVLSQKGAINLKKLENQLAQYRIAYPQLTSDTVTYLENALKWAKQPGLLSKLLKEEKLSGPSSSPAPAQ